MERFFGSLRRELLDLVIIFHEEHLRNLISRYVNWYEKFRLHQGLEGKSPVSREEERKNNTEGKIISIPILGGSPLRTSRRVTQDLISLMVRLVSEKVQGIRPEFTTELVK